MTTLILASAPAAPLIWIFWGKLIILTGAWFMV